MVDIATTLVHGHGCGKWWELWWVAGSCLCCSLPLRVLSVELRTLGTIVEYCGGN